MDKFMDFQDAFIGTAHKVMGEGREIRIKGKTTKELTGYAFSVDRADERMLTIPERNTNPFAQIAETLWMIRGRDDLDWLELYIPQCKKWSDDGLTWRGAYGPRLRAWNSMDDVLKESMLITDDQVELVLQMLKEKPKTRQAVMTIWDPDRDWVKSKDIPCNNWLHWVIRENELHLSVAVRSNDVVYGFSHNDFFSWSVLLQMMAYWTGTNVGKINWFAGSYHIYERHWDLVSNLSDGLNIYDHGVGVARFSTDFGELDGALDKMFAAEESFREKGGSANRLISIIEGKDEFLYSAEAMLKAYVAYKNEWHDLARHLITIMPNNDMKWASIFYLTRNSDHYSVEDFDAESMLPF